MKENIEEDIKRIKQRIEDVKEYLEYGLPYSEYLDLENSFDHILSDYKRALKENEELKSVKKECIFREDGAEECLWRCSNCNKEWLFYEGTPEDNELKYCPHCGAKVTKYENYIEGEIEVANKMEEDIKILENWLEELNELFNETHINNTKERKALDHILIDYKRALKENKVLKAFTKFIFQLDDKEEVKSQSLAKEQVE